MLLSKLLVSCIVSIYYVHYACSFVTDTSLPHGQHKYTDMHPPQIDRLIQANL